MDISKKSLTELKAMVYDLTMNLRILENEIAKRSQLPVNAPTPDEPTSTNK